MPIHVFVSYLLCGSLSRISHLWRSAVLSCSMPIHLSLLMGLAAPSSSLTCHMAPCWYLLPLVAHCSHFMNCVVPAWDWLLSWPAAHCLPPLQGLEAFYLNHYKETTKKGSRKNNKASEKKIHMITKEASGCLCVQFNSVLHRFLFLWCLERQKTCPSQKNKISYFNKIML